LSATRQGWSERSKLNQAYAENRKFLGPARAPVREEGMLHVDTARWNETPEDLLRLATGAPHPRTRERFLALYQVTQQFSAFGWSKEAGRRHSTVLEWVRKYNERGPAALTFARTGGSSSSPFCLRSESSSAG
jgi:hypothetical protein